MSTTTSSPLARRAVERYSRRQGSGSHHVIIGSDTAAGDIGLRHGGVERNVGSARSRRQRQRRRVDRQRVGPCARLAKIVGRGDGEVKAANLGGCARQRSGAERQSGWQAARRQRQGIRCNTSRTGQYLRIGNPGIRRRNHSRRYHYGRGRHIDGVILCDRERRA